MLTGCCDWLTGEIKFYIRKFIYLRAFYGTYGLIFKGVQTIHVEALLSGGGMRQSSRQFTDGVSENI